MGNRRSIESNVLNSKYLKQLKLLADIENKKSIGESKRRRRLVRSKRGKIYGMHTSHLKIKLIYTLTAIIACVLTYFILKS